MPAARLQSATLPAVYQPTTPARSENTETTRSSGKNALGDLVTHAATGQAQALRRPCFSPIPTAARPIATWGTEAAPILRPLKSKKVTS